LAVLLRLREAGHVAYFAGGSVRDLLLGAEPKDFDVATDAPPQRVRELFSNTQAVGASFGVILVRHRRSQIEVATFRAESGYDDGRHPSEVHFTNADQDAKRRDFTINGLFYDPVTRQVIDYVGGQADLQNRLIRAIGNPAERFDEDSLRLLRAVRFSARLGFSIEPATAAAIVAHAPQLKRISPERIAEELRIMLTPPTRVAAWRMLWELGLLPVVMRFLHIKERPRDSDRPFLFDRVDPGKPVAFGLAVASAVVCYRMQVDVELTDPRALLSTPTVNSALRAMRQALKISNEESDQMSGTLSGLEPLLRDEPPRVAVMKRFLARPTAPRSRSLLSALASVGVQKDRAQWLERELSELEETEFAPAPLIDGDVLTSLGMQPGPMFKRILNEVYDAQLEGRVKSREEAIAMAKRIAGCE
jgi:poly(A) polymerase